MRKLSSYNPPLKVPERESTLEPKYQKVDSGKVNTKLTQ